MITSGVSSNLNWVSHEFPFIITHFMAKTKFVSRIYETYIFNIGLFWDRRGEGGRDQSSSSVPSQKKLLRAGIWKSDKSLNRP